MTMLLLRTMLRWNNEVLGLFANVSFQNSFVFIRKKPVSVAENEGFLS